MKNIIGLVIMITNGEVTVYHGGFDSNTRLEKWVRRNYDNVWWFGGRNSSLDMGFENANDVKVTIWYNLNNVNIKDFSIGDMLIKGHLENNISKKADLSNYDVYEITSMKDNNFGSFPHIKLGGK